MNRLDQLNALRDLTKEHYGDLMAYIDRLIADEIAGLSGKSLSIPWVSQLGPDAAFAPGDCGPACLASWLHWLGHSSVTVDQVSAAINLPHGYRYTMPAHLIHAARTYGHNLYWRRYLDLAALRVEIDANEPCIVLVHYGALPDLVKFDPGYTSGHWLLVVGYSGDDITYLDPYGTEHGRKTILATEFDLAWGMNHLDGNSDRQALRLRR